MESYLPDAAAEMRAILEKQITSLRDTIAMLVRVQPEIEASKRYRPALRPDVAAFFQPEPPALLPACLPDTTIRPNVTDSMMYCPAGAQVYNDRSSVSCAIPGQSGVSLSMPHGLTLNFGSDGRLQSQRFYDRGLLRWSIEYYMSGGRESEGFYVSTEPKAYTEHGLHTRYALGGVVTSQCYWANGTKHGWSKMWEEDGFPIVATLYVEGREVESVYPDGGRERRSGR